MKPRPPPKVPNVRARARTPWDFYKSVFAPFRRDHADLYKKCFEVDWKSSKIPNLIKNEEDRKVAKEVL